MTTRRGFFTTVPALALGAAALIAGGEANIAMAVGCEVESCGFTDLIEGWGWVTARVLPSGRVLPESAPPGDWWLAAYRPVYHPDQDFTDLVAPDNPWVDQIGAMDVDAWLSMAWFNPAYVTEVNLYFHA